MAILSIIKNKNHFIVFSYKSVRININVHQKNIYCLCTDKRTLILTPYNWLALHGIISIELPDHTNRLTALELPFLSNITLSLTLGISITELG